MAAADITRFQESLSSAKSALVVLPQNPSLDAAAAGLALGLALDKSNIATTVSAPSPITVELNRLIGVDKIRGELGGNNVVISFANYPAENIDRVSYDIDNGQFALSVSLKTGTQPPGKEQVKVTPASGSHDVTIVIGADYPDGLGEFAQNKGLLEKGQLAIVSNAPLSGWDKRAIELINPAASSVSEVALEIIEGLKLPVDEDVATNLFSGIEAGTSNFTAANVSSDTFTKAAQLLQNGAKRSETPVPQGPVVPGPQEQFGPAEEVQTVPQPGAYKGPILP